MSQSLSKLFFILYLSPRRLYFALSGLRKGRGYIQITQGVALG
jgi:hypothetical protein